MTTPEQLAETVRKALGKTNFHGLHDEAEAALSSLLAAYEEMRQERLADVAAIHREQEARRAAERDDSVRPLLTVPELARVLRVGRTTVYRLVNSGSLRPVVVGERIRFRPEDVDAYLERQVERLNHESGSLEREVRRLREHLELFIAFQQAGYLAGRSFEETYAILVSGARAALGSESE